MLSTPQYSLQLCNSTFAPHNLLCITNILKTIKNNSCRHTTTHLPNAYQLLATKQSLSGHTIALVRYHLSLHPWIFIKKRLYSEVTASFPKKDHSHPKARDKFDNILLPILYARKHAPQADLEETERIPTRVAGEVQGWER